MNQQSDENRDPYGGYVNYQDYYREEGVYYTPSSENGNNQQFGNKKSRGSFGKIVGVLFMGLLFGACAGVAFLGVTKLGQGREEESLKISEPIAVVKESVPRETLEKGGVTTVYDVSLVAENTMPSIVSIDNTFTESTSFFGQALEEEVSTSGSGIIVGQNETELLIVTNSHVIAEEEGLIVTFCDGTYADAYVKGDDMEMDLAVVVVKLEEIKEETGKAIAVAKMGDSEKLKVGQPVIAIGNALGYGQSVTTGVVSALNRSLNNVQDENGMELQFGDQTFIQTDAAINPGNSGGALLDLEGRVIGINSSKIGGDAVEGMGYAIPISAAEPIIGELVLRETRQRFPDSCSGFLGIVGVTVVQEQYEIYEMPQGVYIREVQKNSAAEKAGIVKGNIITKLDGESIQTMEELQNGLKYYEAGTTVELTVMEAYPGGYEEKVVEVVLGKRP